MQGCDIKKKSLSRKNKIKLNTYFYTLTCDQREQ